MFEGISAPMDFFKLVAAEPKMVLAGLRKACGTAEVRRSAIASPPVGGTSDTGTTDNVDRTVFLRCEASAYAACNARDLNMHMVAKHGTFSDLQFCVDDHPVCTVCGLWFGARSRVISHMQDKSPICRANVLLRGRWLGDDTAAELCTADAASRRGFMHQGLQKRFADKLCVRTFGPHRMIFDLSGEVVASDNGCLIRRGGIKPLPVQLVTGEY